MSVHFPLLEIIERQTVSAGTNNHISILVSDATVHVCCVVNR